MTDQPPAPTTAELLKGKDSKAFVKEFKRRELAEVGIGGTLTPEARARIMAETTQALAKRAAAKAERVPIPDNWADHGLRSHQRLAARLAAYAKGRLVWVNGTGWHYWNGKRLARDEHNRHAHAILADVLRITWQEAMPDRDLQADVKACMSASGSNGVLDLASTLLFTEYVDQDPYLLNCQNGTLDLHTLKLRPHDPADMITKITGAAYDPAATGKVWKAFLESSLPDPDSRDYLGRYIGQALIGRVIEHYLVFATGTGRNGKGVFARSVSKALGGYGITASNDLLIATRYGQQRSAGELASRMRLRGARLAVMSELAEGARLDEATMKSLTGGDTIEAKHMGQNPVQFDPSHSFLMLTNDLPKFDGRSKATQARIRVVPFDVSFEGREDTTLEDRIEAELETVLAWAVAGLAAYRERGLDAPEAVRRADEAYRSANDPMSAFVEDECIISPAAIVSSARLLEAYNDWAQRNGEQRITARRLAALAAGIDGVESARTNSVRGFTGIGLAARIES